MSRSMTRHILQRSIWRIHPNGLLPVPRRAATSPLVKTTRLALAILCIAVQMQGTSSIPVCMPIASHALMHGKQRLATHHGRSVVPTISREIYIQSKDLLLMLPSLSSMQQHQQIGEHHCCSHIYICYLLLLIPYFIPILLIIHRKKCYYLGQS